MATLAADETVPGFVAPVHWALTEPILLGGAPRAVAILRRSKRPSAQPTPEHGSARARGAMSGRQRSPTSAWNRSTHWRSRQGFSTSRARRNGDLDTLALVHGTGLQRHSLARDVVRALGNQPAFLRDVSPTDATAAEIDEVRGVDASILEKLKARYGVLLDDGESS